MKKKFLSLISIITVVILSQACASQKDDLRAEVPHPAAIKAEANSGVTTELPEHAGGSSKQTVKRMNTNTLKAEAKPNSGVTTELPEDEVELKAGESIAKQISKIKVKDLKSKTKDLSTLVANKNTLLILVKPGCIFCESLLAVMDTLNPTIKPQVLMVLDAAHATEKEFKDKYNGHSKIKATWLYDYDNKFHDELSMSSFPRLLYLDSKQTVIKNQIGLVLPVDPQEQEALKKEQFPIVLQKLSQTTVTWMQGLQ